MPRAKALYFLSVSKHRKRFAVSISLVRVQESLHERREYIQTTGSHPLLHIPCHLPITRVHAPPPPSLSFIHAFPPPLPRCPIPSGAGISCAARGPLAAGFSSTTPSIWYARPCQCDTPQHRQFPPPPEPQRNWVPFFDGFIS